MSGSPSHKNADQLLSREHVVLVCYCTDWQHCHRLLLAGLLERCGAVYGGEQA